MNPAIALAMALAVSSDAGAGPEGVASPAAVEPAPAPRGPRGWIGAGGRNAFELGSPISPDFGVEMIGGAWLLNDHLQPLVHLGWSHGFGFGTSINTLRFSGGLAGGAAFWGERLWLGGALEAGGVRAWAQGGATTVTAWQATIDTSALVELRLAERFLVGAQLGPELCLPRLGFAGTGGAVEWGPVRFNAGLRLGVILGG